MPRKGYIRDFEAAAAGLDVPNVSKICRGDADYSIALTYTHPGSGESLDFILVPSEVSDYPTCHSFFIFTSSDVVPVEVTSALSALADGCTATPIDSMIRILASTLTRHLAHVDIDGDSVMEDTDDFTGLDGDVDVEESDNADDIGSEFPNLDDDSDDTFGLGESGTDTPKIHEPEQGNLMSDMSLKRVRQDLMLARNAGYRVAALVGFNKPSSRSIVSISRRVAKLGLSDDTLHAWGIANSDYITLMISFVGSYLSFDKALEKPVEHSKGCIEFRIGRCGHAKPSVDASITSFQIGSGGEKGSDECLDAKPAREDDFKPIFLSNSLSHFMNHDFLRLLKIRANEKLGSWAAATEELEYQMRNIRSMSTLPVSDKNISLDDHLSTASSRRDSASLPLVAMEFALHYLTKCTDYCLVCHRNLDSTFEALKPYVCENPLCLFQYMSMGFGPRIEADIIDQPYTVDLLLSFCYTALTWNPVGKEVKPRLREFPIGLRLMVPRIFAPVSSGPPGPPRNIISASSHQHDTLEDTTQGKDTSISIKFKPLSKRGVLSPGYEGNLSVGQWVAILYGTVARPMSGNAVHDVVTGSVSNVLFSSFELEHTDYLPLMSSNPGDEQGCDNFSLSANDISLDVEKPSLLFPFDHDVEGLSIRDKVNIGRLLICTMPPVLEMRKFLLRHPQHNLTSYKALSPAAFGLLRWVISSNRSCITLIRKPQPQHDAAGQAATENSSSHKAHEEKTPTSTPGRADLNLESQISANLQRYHIDKMDEFYQFRFLQGSPEKERRFISALSNPGIGINSKYPTLFAWHGSNLANWHSIARTGLDFQETHNGRAYGNGVYLSRDYDISACYSPFTYDGRKNAAIRMSFCVALCEVINAPQKFISCQPHYVVSETDWIQCRYLFVSVDSSRYSRALHSSTALYKQQSTMTQCPQMECRGPNGWCLTIPKAAAVSFSTPTQQPSHKDSYESEPDDDETLEFFGEKPGLPLVAVTDFTPGSLDVDSLRTLKPPSYATDGALKAITREVKVMAKLMDAKPPHELGWYINLSGVENLFQLIVELHSFDLTLPLASDMQRSGTSSIVLEMRFGGSFPLSPPFVRVIRPRFLPFSQGGGGHITIGGAICMELLTNSGWSPACSLETVLVQVRAAICSTDPPARLQSGTSAFHRTDYGINEAVDAYERFARTHGWQVPEDLKEMTKEDGRIG